MAVVQVGKSEAGMKEPRILGLESQISNDSPINPPNMLTLDSLFVEVSWSKGERDGGRGKVSF